MTYHDDIPASLAIAAHGGTSFDPDRRGNSERNDYANHLESVHAMLTGLVTDPAQEAVAAEQFARYRENFKRRRILSLRARSRIVSTMIAGPANFPVHRMEKRNATYSRMLDEECDWRTRALKAAAKAIRAAHPEGDTSGPISSDDANAPMRLRQETAHAQAIHAAMIACNKVIRANISREDKVSQLAVLGLPESLLSPGVMGNTGFASFELTNSNARIKRMQTRLAVIDIRRAQPSGSATIGDIRISDEVADNRLRIYFPGKPDAMVRDRLKRNGFKWSPNAGAWQRMRGPNALYAAKCALELPSLSLEPSHA